MPEERAVIYFESPAFDRLRGLVLRKPLTALKLGARAQNGLERSGITSVRHLLDRARAGMLSPRNVGERTCLKVEQALRHLADSIQSDGSVDWSRYRTLRKSGAKNAKSAPSKSISVRLTSVSLCHLTSSARAQPLGMLHLNPRATNGLTRQRIHSVGAFVDRLRRGLVKMRAVGLKSVNEIHASYEALALSATAKGEIDWLGYAERRGFLILPDEEEGSIFSRDFGQAFLEIIRAAVESTFGPTESLIFRRQVLREPSNWRTPANAKKALGYTRQAMALIRDKILAVLRRAIFDDDYTGSRFRFRDSFVRPLRRLKEALAKADRAVLSYAQWERVLGETWAIKSEQLGTSENALLILLNYRVFRPTMERHEPIVLPKSGSTSSVTTALNLTKRLLRTFPRGVSQAQLVKRLRSEGLAVELDPAELFRLIKTTLDVEQTGRTGKLLRVPIESLTRVTDRLERIFYERGKPMTAPQLIEELSRFKERRRSTRKPAHLRNALSEDKRFKPIARSGFWALAEWDHIEGRTIPNIAADLLRTSKKPMTERELYPLIAAKRPISFKSLSSVLRDDGRFRRVGPRTWELKRLLRGKQ